MPLRQLLFDRAALFGYFADRYRSRKTPFIIGLVAMGVSTVLFVVGRDPYVLLAARALQGVSGAAVGVIGFTLLVESCPKNLTRKPLDLAVWL